MIKYTNNIYKGYESAKNVIRIGRDFEKSAYEMADPVKEFVETLKPGPGTTYDWVNAMGAGEVYGANSRGDYFPRTELIAHHKTFETNPAHVYVQHNNKDPQIKLGDVLFSHYNNDTDRVELIQSLEEDRLRKYAPDWVRYSIQKGENYNTSMGTKVAYDECSVCHQKNKTVADYCGHLKTAMNDWVDGTHVHAINIAPNFFDNSIVRRGADKIARKLSKVASADFDLNKTLLTDNDFYNVNKKYFFLSDTFSKTASINEPYINETNLPTLTPNLYALNLEELNLLSQYPLNDVLGTFKEAQLELLPYEYQHLVLNSMGNGELAENLYNRNVCFTIPNEGNHNNIKLGFNEDILSLVENIIPYKTLSKPFVFYRSILEPAGVMSGFMDKTAAVSENNANEVLTYIGKSYVDYLNTGIEKEAGIIDFLLSMFFAVPDITRRAESLARVQHASAINRRSTERTNPVGHLPFYNPLFRSEFLEKNSGALGRTWDFIKKHKKPVGVGVAGGVGLAGTSYLAGDAVRKELEGEDPAVTAESLGGMARRHPIATTVGLAGATYLGLKGAGKLFKKKVPLAKTASNVDPEYIKSYKEFLATQSPEFILDILENIPDNIFNNICYN